MRRVSAVGSRNASGSGAGLGAYVYSMRVGVGVSGSEASVWSSATSDVCRIEAGGHSMGVGVGGSESEASVWLAETSVVCRTIGGLPGTLRVVVTFGEDVGSGNEEYFVDRYVSGAARVKVAVTGEASVEWRLWASDTFVVCRVGADVGETLGAVWISGVKMVSLRWGAFYDGLSGSSLRRVSAVGIRNASGHGVGLGVYVYSMRVGVGVSGSKESVWPPAASDVCRKSDGAPGMLWDGVTFGRDVDSGNEAFFVDQYGSGVARVKVAGTGDESDVVGVCRLVEQWRCGGCRRTP